MNFTLQEFARFFCILVAVTLLSSYEASAQEPSNATAPQFAESVSDLLAVSDQKLGTLLFVADAKSGAVYFYRHVKRQTDRVGLNQFQLFFQSDVFRHPSALAYRNGKLLICDREASAVLEVDLETRKENVLIQGSPLQKPEYIAVSRTGRLAIIDGHARSVILSDEKGVRLTMRVSLSSPSRAIFGRNDDLLVLDRGLGNVFLFTNGDSSQQPQVKYSPVIPEPIKNRVGRIDDFALYRGVYYFVGGGRVVAYARGTGTILPLHIKDSQDTAAAKVTVSDDSLFIVDERNRAVLLLPRPTPVSVTGEGDANRFNGALANLYGYLASGGTLSRREVTLQRTYNSLDELLTDQGVIAGGEPRKGSRPVDQAQFVKFMCELNEWSCTSRSQLVDKLRAGQKVIVPAVSISSDLVISPVNLGGRAVRDVLAERVTPEQFSRIDAYYLARNNVGLLNTLDAVLVRSRFLPASTPRTDLEPGTIIRLENGKESIIGNVAQCGVKQTKVEQSAFRLSPTTISREFASGVLWQPGDSLPLAESQRLNADADWAKRGIKEIEFDAGKAIVEKIAIDTPDQATTACLQKLVGQDGRIVHQSVKVFGGRYAFRRKDGSAAFFNDVDFKKWGVAGHADTEKRWGLLVDTPFYIGYRVLDSNALWSGLPKATLDWWDEKTEIGQDIFSETTGVLNLPITQWRVSVLANVSEVNNKQSDLHKIEKMHPGIHLLSEEEFGPDVKALGVGMYTLDDPTLESIQIDRDRLKKKIKYVAPVPGISDVIIGLAESATSVARDHPDFRDADGRSAWYQEQDCCGLEPVPQEASVASISNPPVKKFSESADHGSHVAGLLAAREKSTAPGLLPTVGLFLIDTRSPSGLERSIENARSRGIYLFNFSFVVPGDDSLDTLKLKMRDYWFDRLFIAAAGNDGKDLRNVSRLRIPVSWSDVKNIVGVGASDGNDNPLGAWQPDASKPETLQGTNYSREHLQLFAPGLQIYSTASNNSYALATGSSQAVPQVTAAAAMLLAQDISDPLVIKARLIYTADWYSPQFDGKVWGGALNYKQAVWEPRRNLLVTQSNREEIKSIVPKGNTTIKLVGGDLEDPRGESISPPNQIAFANILRIQLMPDGRFRIHYVDKDSLKLRLLKDVVSIEGKLRCSEYKQWDGTRFVDADCGDGIQVGQFFNYVARVPNSVRF